MDDIKISDKKFETAIDLCVLLAVEDIAKKEKKRVEDVMPEFVCSETGKLLYDAEARLWWSSPMEISDMYMSEKERNHPVSGNS